MTFLEVAEAVLKEAEYPLTYKEIWEQAKVMGLDKKVGSEAKKPEINLQSQIYVNMKNKSDSNFCIANKKPTTFWLQSRRNEIIGKETEIEQKRQEKYEKEFNDNEHKKGFEEKHLHPLLVKFLNKNEQFKLYCKTIDAGKSKKGGKGLGEWNHPDIVGIHFPFDDYQDNTLDLLRNISKSSYKIYSFEIKKIINLSKLKEYYFQAVSNSSWANEGYLVAYEITLDDERAYSEAERLNESFGIGMIELKSSKVLFEARERELDIRTLNMLVEINTDFKEFIENVNKDIQTNDPERIAKIKYDKVLSDDEIEAHKKKCGIVQS